MHLQFGRIKTLNCYSILILFVLHCQNTRFQNLKLNLVYLLARVKLIVQQMAQICAANFFIAITYRCLLNTCKKNYRGHFGAILEIDISISDMKKG